MTLLLAFACRAVVLSIYCAVVLLRRCRTVATIPTEMENLPVRDPPQHTEEHPLIGNKIVVAAAFFCNVVVWLGVFSLLHYLGESRELASWPLQQCIIEKGVHLHISFGCFNNCHDGERTSNLYHAWVKVRTSDGRELVAFPHLDGSPLQTASGIKRFQARYTPAADGSPLSVPCAINPRHAAERRCVDAPIEGDKCDGFNAPARCRACLRRVFLGDESDVKSVVWRQIAGWTFALAFFGLIFVPIGLVACCCAFPRCGAATTRQLVAIIKSRNNGAGPDIQFRALPG